MSNVYSMGAGVVSSSAQNSRRGSGHVEFDPTNTVKLPSLGKGPLTKIAEKLLLKPEVSFLIWLACEPNGILTVFN